MSATTSTTRTAGKEVYDFVRLVIDGTPNKEQIAEFALQGFQAVQALAAVGIPREQKAAILLNIFRGALDEATETDFALPE